MAGELVRQACAAAQGLVGALAQAGREQARQELAGLIHGVLDVPHVVTAQVALVVLAAHARGASLAPSLRPHLDTLLVYRTRYNRGLARTTPDPRPGGIGTQANLSPVRQVPVGHGRGAPNGVSYLDALSA